MGLFNWLFGKPETPVNLVRKHQRTINKAIRNLERERISMEQQEKKLIAEIKKAAASSQMVFIPQYLTYRLLLNLNIVFIIPNL
jgi:charged multivesicular body protein 2A